MLKRITKYQNPSNPLPTLEDILNQQYTEEELQVYKQREEKRKQERAKRFNTSNATRALMSLSSGPAVPGDAPVLDESTLDLLVEGKIKEANQNQQQIDKNKTIASASILSLPLMAGEFTTYGALGGLARLTAGTVGSAAGSWLLGKAGEAGDRKFNTTFLKPIGQTVGGFAGFGAGMGATAPILRRLATKGITLHMPQETFMKLRSEGFHNAYNKIKSLPAQVKYYGPTMGKSYAARNNQNLIDLDTWGRAEYDQLAKKYGYRDWREMILSDKGDYNEEYKQLIKDQIKRIQSDPKYNGKTIIVSNASLLKPNSGITFANTPVIPERSVMAIRNNTRHPWESITHGEEWWDSLQAKGTPLKIDNRFVSEIEGNKVISFTPNQPQPSADVHRVRGLRSSTSATPMTETESELNSIPPEGFEKLTGLTKMNTDLNLFRLQNSKERPILFNKVQDHDNVPVYGQIYPTKEMSLLKNAIEKRIQHFQKKQAIKDFKDLPGKEDRFFNQSLLDNVDKKPIYLTYDDSPSSWLGWFSPKTGKSYINVAKQEPSNLTSLLLHEGVMHPTDDVARSLSTKTGNIPVINLYKGVSKPSFLKIYPDFTDFAQNWTEARATNGELIHLINARIAQQFNLPIEHVYRNPKLLEQYVDSNLKTPEDVIKILNDLQSSYSLDYAKRFDVMDAKQKEIYSRRIKDMIKRYPVWLGVLPFLDQEKKIK